MAMQVCNGALLQCSFGAAPSTLVVTPENRVLGMAPDATIMDNIPMKNIMPFAMCSCPANPAVISATSAALGVFTPMPCMPVTPAPWAPGSPTVLIGYKPALNDTSILNCVYGGVIQVVVPGQFTAQIP